MPTHVSFYKHMFISNGESKFRNKQAILESRFRTKQFLYKQFLDSKNLTSNLAIIDSNFVLKIHYIKSINTYIFNKLRVLQEV